MSVVPITIRLSDTQLSLQEKLDSLPTGPGVYQHKDANGAILYVGKARNLRSRVRQYFQASRSPDPRIAVMLSRATDLDVIVTDTEVEALILEANLIKQLKPRFNVNLKDDKSYPYIVVTNEPFPRVFVTRRIVRDGSRYFGPYTDVKNVRAALKAVRDIFPIRSCNYRIDDDVIRKRSIKVCLDYHIKKCEGPCEGLVSSETYGAMIDNVASLLEGRTGSLIEQLRAEMEGHASAMRFEEAAILRDRIRGLESYRERQKAADIDRGDRDILACAAEDDDACGVILKVRDGKLVGRRQYVMGNVQGKPEGDLIGVLLQQHYLDARPAPPDITVQALPPEVEALVEWLSADRVGGVRIAPPASDDEARLIRMTRANARFLLDEVRLQRLKRSTQVPHPVQSLQRDLRLPEIPRRIECFDNSNIQGSDAVASLVVFVDGKAKKSEYRKFRIRTVQGPDDFASMAEVVERRYRRVLDENGTLPDLIVVDGGKGQLSSAVGALERLGLARLPVIGLAKRLEEVFLEGQSEPLFLPRTSSGLRLLQRIRDEAHRFAISYHRELRTRRILHTELDLIAGIGQKRARDLLEAFGSVQGVRFATLAQLVEIVGEKTATRVKEYFEGETDDDPEAPHNPDAASGTQ